MFKERKIKATFLEGRWAENYPELVKLIHDHEHEIGNHGSVMLTMQIFLMKRT